MPNGSTNQSRVSEAFEKRTIYVLNISKCRNISNVSYTQEGINSDHTVFFENTTNHVVNMNSPSHPIVIKM